MSDSCTECGRKLVPEERLLSAIFGNVDSPLCTDCTEVQFEPRCHECGEITQLALNGTPCCAKHMEVVR